MHFGLPDAVSRKLQLRIEHKLHGLAASRHSCKWRRRSIVRHNVQWRYHQRLHEQRKCGNARKPALVRPARQLDDAGCEHDRNHPDRAKHQPPLKCNLRQRAIDNATHSKHQEQQRKRVWRIRGARAAGLAAHFQDGAHAATHCQQHHSGKHHIDPAAGQNTKRAKHTP